MWFDPAPILSYDRGFNFVIGNRGGGKTFNTFDLLINRFIQYGDQWVLIRRTKEEIKNVKDKLFTRLKSAGKYPDHHLEVVGNKMMVDGQVMGEIVPLNDAHNFKMGNYNLKWIVFDEFIPEEGAGFTMRDEVGKFLGLYETMCRMDRVRVFFLANSITMANDFFIHFKINFPRGTKMWKHPTRPIMVQVYVNQAYIDAKQKTEFADLIRGTRFEDYMINNEFVNDNYNFIEPMTGNATFQFSYTWMGRTYGVWMQMEKGTFHINENIDPSCPTRFAFSTNDFNPNHLLFDSAKHNPYIKRAVRAHDIGLVRFDKLTTKTAFYDIVNYL